MTRNKIPAFSYLSGSEFTENLKRLTGFKTFLEMAEVYDVPKATFSTWNTHNRTAHELIVRVHLAHGIPIPELALKPEDWHLAKKERSTERPAAIHQSYSASIQLQTTTVLSHHLSNGELLEIGKTPYSVSRIHGFKLQDANLIEIETNEAILLIDKNQTDPVTGNYLISIDGRHSINVIQRLPGKKLAINFNDATIELDDEDIEVIGKVVLETRTT